MRSLLVYIFAFLGLWTLLTVVKFGGTSELLSGDGHLLRGAVIALSVVCAALVWSATDRC